MKPPLKMALTALLTTTSFLFPVASAMAADGGTNKPVILSYFGKAPRLDGKLSPGEWGDAFVFRGVRDWVPEFSPVTSDEDLALTGYVKHDARWLYFAFDVTDNLLYGIDTERWLPDENPRAHELSREGYPWFGDEMELLINATGRWHGEEEADGNGSSWQMVCNLTKSRLGGVGKGGLLEGEPRTKLEAWNQYHRWILSGAQKAVARRKENGRGYILEWAVRFDPCLEIAPGKFYSVKLGPTEMGLNIALGDLDLKSDGQGNFGNFRHEQWLSGVPHLRTQKRHWGVLRILGRERKPRGTQ